MVDIVSPQTRSRMMSGIRGKNTKPELLVRRELHGRGFRFRLHDKRLPGKPDLYLPRFNAVIEVNGCFWHGHDCPLFKLPSTRRSFWREKIGRNRQNDIRKIQLLEERGLRFATVWECALRGPDRRAIDDVGDELDVWLCGGLSGFAIRGTELSQSQAAQQ